MAGTSSTKPRRRTELNGRCTDGGTAGGATMKSDAAEEHEAEPERDRAEGDDPRDLDRRQPPGVVEPVAQRAADQSREADVVVERVADERGERDPAVRQRVADVAERQRVVAGHDQVAGEGEEDGERRSARAGSDAR